MKECPICHKTYDEGESCDDCGAILVEKEMSLNEGSKAPAKGKAEDGSVQVKSIQLLTCSSCGWRGNTNDDYCPECGARLDSKQQIKVVEKSNDSVKLLLPDSTEIVVSNFPFQFGRDQMSSYPDSMTVSSKHFRMTREATTNGYNYYVEDAESRNGTSINGNVIGNDRKSYGKFLIRDGDVIGLVVNSESGTSLFKLTFKLTKEVPLKGYSDTPR
jgi:hypothetical protein